MGDLGALLGAKTEQCHEEYVFWGLLGAFWGAPWDRLGAILGDPGAILGRLGAILGPSWTNLRPLRPILVDLGRFLELYWPHLGLQKAARTPKIIDFL